MTPTLTHRARLAIAAVLALALPMIGLAGASVATAASPQELTLSVTPHEPWWAGADLGLGVALAAADGTPMKDVPVEIAIDGELRRISVPGDDVLVRASDLAPGPHEVTVVSTPAMPQYHAQWSGTVVATAGGTPTTLTVDMPDGLAETSWELGIWIDAHVKAADGRAVSGKLGVATAHNTWTFDVVDGAVFSHIEPKTYLDFVAGANTVTFTFRGGDGLQPSSVTKSLWLGAPAVRVGIQGHVENIGWQPWTTAGQVVGTTGQGLRVEALRFRLENQVYSGDIVASAHVQDIGWMPAVGAGGLVGTEGQAKRVEAFTIQLTGELADHYDIYYRTHAQNLGWLAWTKNGAPSGTAGLGYRLEAVDVQLVAKGDYAEQPTAVGAAFIDGTALGGDLTYQSHVQNIGWQPWVSGGQTAGTTGQGLRVEALRFHLNNQVDPGDIVASAHVQDIGWMPAVGAGGLVGTEGQAKRVEALTIQLTDLLGGHYDVYYRTHAENFGWLGWAKNGEPSGTAGYGYRLEAVEVRLIAKGGPAPTPDSGLAAFYQH